MLIPYLRASVAFSVLSFCALVSAEYPDRPFQFIVASFAGETEKELTRLVAENIGHNYNLPAAILDMDRIESANHIAMASADGYTIGTLMHDSLTIDVINGKSRYQKDSFEAIGVFLEYPLILISSADMPFHDLKGLARHGVPVPVRLAHFGYDQLSTRQATLLASKLGFKFEDGGSYSRPDCRILEKGEADVIITTIELSKTCIEKGTAKAIISISSDRLRQHPDIPTISEHYPEIAISFWSGLFARSGTPEEAIAAIRSTAINALNNNELKRTIERNGVLVHVKTIEESATFVEQQYLRTKHIFDH